jgi:hypothetical protein
MFDRFENDSVAFTDFKEFMLAWLDRASEAGDHFQAQETKDPPDFRDLLRAFRLGPAAPLLLFSRSREALQWLFYVHGFLPHPKDDKNRKELNDLTKDFLSAWLELADEARRHRGTLWDINKRVLEKFGEALDDVNAEFRKPKP